MNLLGLYMVTGIPILIGLVVMFKEAGWPSDRERRNRVLRSVRSGLGTTVFSVGVIVVVSYQQSPDSLVRDTSVVAVLRFLFVIAVPVFFITTIGSYVQYSAWEKTEPLMRGRLRKMVEAEQLLTHWPHEQSDQSDRDRGLKTMVRNLIAFAVTYLLAILYIFWLTGFMNTILGLDPQYTAVPRILTIGAATIGLIAGFLRAEVKRRKK